MLLLVACLAALAPVGMESAADRAALPEFQVIPAATAAELTPAEPVDADRFVRWTRSQGDAGSRRYSALTQIDRGNVAQLAAAWTFHSGDGRRNIQCTPIVVEGVMYGPTAGHALAAWDAATGKERWRHEIPRPAHPGLEDDPARRGLVDWPGEPGHPARLLFGSGRWIYALDPATGDPVAEFGDHGQAPLPTGATVAGAVYRHTFVTAGLYGDLYGYDVRSGALQWRFHTVPLRGEFGGDTWSGPERGMANCWGGLSIDEGRGIVFAAIGCSQPNFVGPGRLGDNLFGDCVVALDAVTGRRLWHFQNVRHDIWDLDDSAPPNLVTIVRAGRRVDAVAAVSKSGILLLLDRASGKPVFPFRLRRAPVSKLPGERTAPYQPDPELPEPISRPGFSPADITDLSPAAHADVAKLVAQSTTGWFEPFTPGVPNIFMGSRGGGEWSGAAVDVPTGRLYVASNRIPSRVTVFAVPADRSLADGSSPAAQTYVQFCAACHGPDRAGLGMVPPLLGLHERMTEEEVVTILRTGRNAMPPAPPTLADAQRKELVRFLLRSSGKSSSGYSFDGFNFLTDREGYPGIKPPWGLLDCYDLNTGRVLWRVPLGEYPELTRRGIPVTGQQNLGGATVTAGGLVFCAGTPDCKLRAFDADTGRILWQAALPWAGYAAPAVYESQGREFVVVTATGGGKVGGPAGDAYVAFALPK